MSFHFSEMKEPCSTLKFTGDKKVTEKSILVTQSYSTPFLSKEEKMKLVILGENGHWAVNLLDADIQISWSDHNYVSRKYRSIISTS